MPKLCSQAARAAAPLLLCSLLFHACGEDPSTPLAEAPAAGESAPETSVSSAVSVYPGNPRYHAYGGAPRVLLGGGAVVTPGNRAAVDRALSNGGTYARVWHNFTIPPAAWKQLSGGKYDLTQWNESYWTQLRDVVGYASSKQLILSVQLFSEPGLECCADRWGVHPFNPANNVNGLGLPSSDGVPEFYRLSNAKLRAIQEAYVARVI
ncbi:MAG: DUF6298 domain-containing protein, partial [Gemmatimonadota bacterium]